MGLWDVFQEVEIQQLRGDRELRDTTDAGREITLQDRAYRAEERFERLLLVVDAAWELLSERAGLTERDLATRIIEIDGRDGARDGRRTTLPRRCSQCDAAISRDRATCLFCGHEEPGSGVFDGV